MKKILTYAAAALALTSPLTAEIKILAFAGSTRKESYNKKLIQEAAAQARSSGAHVTVIDLKDFPMPFYDADLEAKKGMPAQAKRFRSFMLESDVIIISSPEYNSSIPAVLKNALDWASRSEEGKPSRDAFKGKKFLLLSASPGDGGGARGLAHLRAIISNAGGEVLPQQISVSQAHRAFDDTGAFVDAAFKDDLKQLIASLIPAPQEL